MTSPADEAPSGAAAESPAIDVASLAPEVFATPRQRLAAFLIDCAAVMPSGLLLAWIIGDFPAPPKGATGVGLFGLDPRLAKGVSLLSMAALYEIYFTPPLLRAGRTVGMACLGLSLVNAEGRFVDEKSLQRRHGLLVLSLLPLGLGLIPMLWHPQARGWHDRGAGTWVVRSRWWPAWENPGKLSTPGCALLFAPGMLLVMQLMWLYAMVLSRGQRSIQGSATADNGSTSSATTVSGGQADNR